MQPSTLCTQPAMNASPPRAPAPPAPRRDPASRARRPRAARRSAAREPGARREQREARPPAPSPAPAMAIASSSACRGGSTRPRRPPASPKATSAAPRRRIPRAPRRFDRRVVERGVGEPVQRRERRQRRPARAARSGASRLVRRLAASRLSRSISSRSAARLPCAPRELAREPLGLGDDEGVDARLGLCALARVVEPLEREGAHARVEPEARLARHRRGLEALHERALHQPRQRRGHVAHADHAGLRRLDREAPHEGRALPQRASLVLGEQLPRERDRRAERRVPPPIQRPLRRPGPQHVVDPRVDALEDPARRAPPRAPRPPRSRAARDRRPRRGRAPPRHPRPRAPPPDRAAAARRRNSVIAASISSGGTSMCRSPRPDPRPRCDEQPQPRRLPDPRRDHLTELRGHAIHVIEHHEPRAAPAQLRPDPRRRRSSRSR